MSFGKGDALRGQRRRGQTDCSCEDALDGVGGYSDFVLSWRESPAARALIEVREQTWVHGQLDSS